MALSETESGPFFMAPSVLIDRKFENFDEWQMAISGWDMDCQQLNCGHNPHMLRQFASEGFAFGRALMGNPSQRIAASPNNLRTFSIRNCSATTASWCFEPFAANDIIVMPINQEFRGINHGPFEVFTVSLTEELLERTAEVCFQQDWPREALTHGTRFTVPETDMQHLRALIRLFDQSLVEGMAVDLTSELAERFVELLLTHGNAKRTRKLINQKRLLSAATDYMDAHSNIPYSIQEMCQDLGLSKRSLEYMFSNTFGLSPKRYSINRRLHKVREGLAHNEDAQFSISRLASRYGFWHMGQFGRDYRGLYGETPSATRTRMGKSWDFV